MMEISLPRENLSCFTWFVGVVVKRKVVVLGEENKGR
jgi:hypothetical protein